MPIVRALLLTAILSLLAACGGGSSSGSSQAEPQPQAATSTTEPAPPQQTEPVPVPAPVEEPPVAATSNYEPKTLQLSWQAPTQRTDGSALSMSEIGGYEITYIDSTNREFNITISDAAVTEYTLADLAPDTYEFHIFSYDQLNQVSPASASLTLGIDNFLPI